MQYGRLNSYGLGLLPYQECDVIIAKIASYNNK